MAYSTLLLGLLGLAQTSLSQPHPASFDKRGTDSAEVQLIIGGGPEGDVLAATFSAELGFTITASTQFADGVDVSWLTSHPNNSATVYANDENSNLTRVLHANPNDQGIISSFSVEQEINGSSGVVFHGINGAAGTRMCAAAFGQGTMDIYDVSSGAGDAANISILATIVSDGTPGPITDRQASAHPHQAQIDPSGRFFVINDLGTDTILVIDTKDDNFIIVKRFQVKPGCGPRHAVFYPPNADQATHYIFVCEIQNTVNVLQVINEGALLDFVEGQSQDSFGGGPPPANRSTAAVGEIQISADGADVYVSNRLTGNDTDNIVHFRTNLNGSDLLLDFSETVSSGGQVPRMFSLSLNNDIVFVTNQAGDSGLVALERSLDTGILGPDPVASLPLSAFGDNGPQFVQEVVSSGYAPYRV